MLPDTLTVKQAAAVSGTIATVLAATALAVLSIFPAFALLYSLDQRHVLPEEGLVEPQAAGVSP
jgi:hypothetical protein